MRQDGSAGNSASYMQEVVVQEGVRTIDAYPGEDRQAAIQAAIRAHVQKAFDDPEYSQAEEDEDLMSFRGTANADTHEGHEG